MNFSAWTLLGALGLGTGIGVLAGMFGVGGGFLMTPLINIVLGVPMQVAVGTTVLQILGTSAAGIYRRRKDNLVDLKLAVVLVGGSVVGSRLGLQALQYLESLGDVLLSGGSMPAAQFYLLIVFFVLLALIAGWVFYDTHRDTGDGERVVVGLFSKLKVPPYSNFASLEQPRMSIPVLSYFGLLLGFMTGLMGIGGGVIMLPALVYLVGMRTHRAAATSLAVVLFTAIISTVNHAAAGNASVLLALPLLVGGTVGVQLGISMADRMGGKRLTRYFAFVVLSAMLMVAFKLVAALI